MSVSEPQPIKATSPNSTTLLTTLPMVVTTIDTIDTMDKANNNHNRNIPRFVTKSSRLTHMTKLIVFKSTLKLSRSNLCPAFRTLSKMTDDNDDECNFHVVDTHQ